MSTAKPPQLVEVELASDHRHNGVDYQAGDTIRVTPKQQAFLQSVQKLRGPATAATKE